MSSDASGMISRRVPMGVTGPRWRARRSWVVVAVGFILATTTVAIQAPVGASATFTVTSSADPGTGGCDADCTLREAITAANATVDPDTISFNIPGGGAQTIRPTSNLPVITRPVVIDGTSQAGYAGTPLIELDGSLYAGGIGFWASSAVTIEGFAINRFGNRGVLFDSGSSGSIVRANYLGTTADGSAAAGNPSFDALELRSSNNLVGGTSIGDRNVIVGLLRVGPFGGSVTGNVVQGNFIGTNAAGTAGINNRSGIWVDRTTATTIGGTAPGAGNLISGNAGNAIEIDISATGTVVQGNFIGTNAAGTAAVPNTSAGMQVYGPGTIIGGTAAGAGNVISGNAGDGIRLQTDHARVEGNHIGTTSSGAALANGGSGLSLIGLESHDNTVGGTVPGAANTIANNGAAGIAVLNGTHQKVEGNAIFDNVGLAIDIDADGVTANDVGDGDIGANNRQNFPVITAATSSAGSTTVEGSLATAEGAYRVEFFANDACDPSGNGEAQRFLWAQDISVVSGAGLFSTVIADDLTAKALTAIATSADGDTSELSVCRTVVAFSPPAQYALTVTKDGSGTGSVSSGPAGIACGATCSASFDQGTLVTLTPTANAGSVFGVWSGACTGSGACQVTMDAAKSVTATFSVPVAQYALTVTRNGAGTGSVSSSPPGIACGANCTASFDSGTVVTLALTANAGSVFGGWSGACTGAGSCVVTMDAAKSVTATFELAPQPPSSLQITGTGPASVVLGDPMTYEFTVVNGLAVDAPNTRASFGASLQHGVVVPVTVTSSKGSCNRSGTCNLGRLQPGESVTITVGVSSPFGGSLAVKGTVLCSCADGVLTDNIATIHTTIIPRTDLTITITNPSTVTGGKPITWVGRVGGVSPSVIEDLVVEFDVPDGIAPTSVRPSSGGTCDVVGQLVRCTFPRSWGTTSVSITGTPIRGGTYNLIGRIVGCNCVDTNPGNNTVTGPDCVHPPIADLRISKHGPSRVDTGDIITWTIEVENRGPDAATDVQVADGISRAVAFVSATPEQGVCYQNNNFLTCYLGTIATDDTVTIVVQARALTKTSSGVMNKATVTCQCWDPLAGPNNTGTAEPVTVWPVVRPVTVTPCAQTTIPGVCNLTLFVHNDNPFPITGGVIELGPLDPTTGPRLDPDFKFPPWYSCVDRGAMIQCTVKTIPTGGRGGLIIPLVLTSAGPLDLTISWNCGCTDGGAVVTHVQPMTITAPCIGGQVLFDSDDTGDRDVYAARIGENPATSWTNLTNNSALEEGGAVWSPKGTSFVFHRGKPGSRKLYIASLDGFGCVKRWWKVPNQPEADNFQPEWSPTAGRLAFISSINGNHDIYTIGIEGSGLTRVTSNAADDRAPSFSKDGARIAFASRRTASGPSADWNIWSAAAGGGDERFLSGPAVGYKPNSADYSPSYNRGTAPDRIVWHTNSGGGWDLWVMDPNNPADKQRLPGPLDEKNADWSSDGARIVYDAGTGTSGIWIMNASGAGRTLIAQTPNGIDQAPSLNVAPPECPSTFTSGGGMYTPPRAHPVAGASGVFRFEYNTYSLKDKIEITYDGGLIFTTKDESGSPASVGTEGVVVVNIPYGPGTSTEVVVTVTGDDDGTAWEYSIC